MTKHKYSTYMLILIFVMLTIGYAIAALDTNDIDDLCNTANSILRRTNGTWQCSVTNYGEIYYHHETDPLVRTFASPNNFTQITGLNISNCQGMTCANDGFTIAKNTTYMIDSTFSFTGGANSDYHCAIFLNGVQQEDCEFQRTMSSGSVGVATISCLKTALVDAGIDLKCEDTNNPVSSMQFYALNINIVEIQ